MKKNVILLLTFALIMPAFLLGQKEGETNPQVPELKAFHEVIFKLWHDAWPNKNLILMKELVPAIDSHLVKIQKAELPGILRDKKSRWDDGVKTLAKIVGEYKNATATSDIQKNLDAAEKLHGKYEKLVRIIRPVLKQIDEFHQTLYPLYHYYMPEYNREKIKIAVQELQVKMDSLNNAELPERLAAKQKSFDMKRRELNKSLKYVVKVVNEVDDEQTVTDAIKKMHTKYQLLEKVFD